MKIVKQKENGYCPARWWRPLGNGKVECYLCPRYCRIPVGSHGFCVVRENHGGKLYSTVYERTTGLAVDPIEKKPLYHFYPGTQILSFGTIGCNLGCKFCQNWHISKVRHQVYLTHECTAESIVWKAREHNCIGIAYTYNEPTIFGEWVMDVARLARERGLKNVLVTNGYVSPNARRELYRDIDAVNVDLKAFTEAFYRKLTLSRLDPVLDTLRWLVHETDVWVEITTLIIPGKNDSERELDGLTKFVARELNPDVPVHFTAFHPDFKMLDHLPTPVETLFRARDIARRNGLNYVYTGNIFTSVGQKTVCRHCGKMVIHRNIYYVQKPNMKGNCCSFCGYRIPGHFGREPVHPRKQSIIL
ncbi:MAG: AmmeMemoRadiSam system radical SAM enzyme [FCB group bacterium]|nr:AmmeMemoRadiSam system radical SAM enzyme [FCB group bacterium]